MKVVNNVQRGTIAALLPLYVAYRPHLNLVVRHNFTSLFHYPLGSLSSSSIAGEILRLPIVNRAEISRIFFEASRSVYLRDGDWSRALLHKKELRRKEICRQLRLLQRLFRFQTIQNILKSVPYFVNSSPLSVHLATVENADGGSRFSNKFV